LSQILSYPCSKCTVACITSWRGFLTHEIAQGEKKSQGKENERTEKKGEMYLKVCQEKGRDVKVSSVSA